MKKKVIFVAGTSYSGSTFLDLILGNDSKSFSCGEVAALFCPSRDHHCYPFCSCGDSECTIWDEIKKNGRRKLYETIFSARPEVDFIVDSSKDPFWIREQTKNLRSDEIEVKNVLIWKTPHEIAHSFSKRRKLASFERSWVGYHRLYFTLIDSFVAVRYYDLTKRAGTLEILCNCLEIPFFETKEKYWNKQHHIIFGNTSARVHLYYEDSKSFRDAKRSLVDKYGKNETDILTINKSIYYEPPSDREVATFVDKIGRKNELLPMIVDLLTVCDIRSDQKSRSLCLKGRKRRLRFNYSLVGLRRAKQLITMWVFKCKCIIGRLRVKAFRTDDVRKC